MQEIEAKDFQSIVLEGKKVVVDFYSTECPPCEALAPKYESIAQQYGDDLTFVKIFRQGNREFAESLGVKSSPTVLFFEDGKQVGEVLTGGIKRSEMVRNIEQMIPSERAQAIRDSIVPTESEYDVAILGGGPAGLTAAIYLGQAKVKTVLIDTQLPGGQVSVSHQISNYPGFVEPQPGFMLSHYMGEQAKNNGADMKLAVEVTKVDLQSKTIEIDGTETIKAKKIVLSTGASPRYLNIPGEKEYKGKGISYCATCDGKYYEAKEVVVVGGGNSAVEEADFITKFASKITLIHQFDALTANKEAQEKLLANPKVSVLYSSEPRSFTQKEDKMIVGYEDLKSKEQKQIETDGVFIFVGMKPNTEMFEGELEANGWGYIVTDEDMHTSMPDIYAVGDMIDKKYRQITTAVADGTIAAMAIAKELL